MQILWYSDMQLKKGVATDHANSLINFIEEKQPDVVINGGDHYDFPSLSKYISETDRASQSLAEDIKVGNDILNRLAEVTQKHNIPHYFLEGNHENRYVKFLQENRHLVGALEVPHYFGDPRLELVRFNVPLFLDGIAFQHHFLNNMSPRPLTGPAKTRIQKLGHSFVQGHEQNLDYAKTFRTDGRVDVGLVCGAFHLHHEGYRTEQNKHHWNGIALLHTNGDGDFDLEAWSVERLMREY